ncbi:TraG/VirD4-like conjugal transfer ATPase [Saccharolobus shibatae B12]|uniref:TraG/VirD4-like conjugal transfer ATPase n=1 Tax=Saccharolobus shibatae (strain ATCC 51178 / DSM 5389 / JCM 8931 / NBRC 15437 / B12) TaxID=523848 RepID=A0A8F5BKM3_SACSH|nr:ATP-binding protein [Saccharolobus shibatae]QXJ27125.1 TraG/VirD4-like conjugal transfer ATPase [Saccharolobus shibatae B12]QXJ30018.1 TraG/VirD4-like conjugal transfer ATPase [Saccharolobus shibatae B12]
MSDKNKQKKSVKTPIEEMRELRWYEVQGYPVLFYSESDRESEYGKFMAEVSSHEKMYVYASYREELVEFEKELFSNLYLQIPRFYVGIPKNDRLQIMRGKEVDFPLPIYKIDREKKHKDYVILEDGRFARALVPDIREPPGMDIEEACLARLYPLNIMPLHLELLMRIEHVPESKVDYHIAAFKRESARRSLATTTSWRQKHMEHLTLLEQDRLNNASTHKFTYMLILVDNDLNVLKEATDSVIANSKTWCVTKLDVPKYVQKELIENWRIDWVRLTMITTNVRLGYLYPFVDSSIIEQNGIFFAITDRGSPVVINPWDRKYKENGHIIVSGFSGAGKTTSIAALQYRLLKRLKEREEDFFLFVLDPIGNYNRFYNEFIAKELNLDVENKFLEEGKPMGLDPVLLHSIDPAAMPVEMALNYLYQAFEVPAELKGVIDIAVITGLTKINGIEKRISNLRELYEYLRDSSNLKEQEASYYVARAVDGAFRNIFQGEPPKFEKNVVVIGFKINDVTTLQTAMGLLLNAILVKLYSLPKSIKKIVVIDEAHRILARRELADIMSRFFRETRNLNTSVIAMSQLITDFTNNEEAKAVYENAATRIILKQKDDKLVEKELAEFAGLTENEIDFVQHASPGMGILNLGNIKTPIYVKLTTKELEAFETEEVKTKKVIA